MSNGSRVLVGLTIAFAGTVILWAIFYFGIYWGYGGWKHRHHRAFATQSVALITPAAQLNELYNDCRNFISYNEAGGGPTWNSVAFFEGRYQITLQLPVAVESPVDGRGIGPARYLLLEFDRIEISGNGSATASFSNNWTITPAQWDKVYAAGGDFSVLNIPIIKGHPLENFDAYISNIHSPR